MKQARTDFPELWVLRHGETEWNTEERLQGRLDSALTPKGVDQALAQGQILAACLTVEPVDLPRLACADQSPFHVQCHHRPVPRLQSDDHHRAARLTQPLPGAVNVIGINFWRAGGVGRLIGLVPLIRLTVLFWR